MHSGEIYFGFGGLGVDLGLFLNTLPVLPVWLLNLQKVAIEISKKWECVAYMSVKHKKYTFRLH